MLFSRAKKGGSIFSSKTNKNGSMLLSKANIGETFKVKSVEGKDKTRKFLFTLGCFEGEQITLISKLAGNYVINIKDSRYAIDEGMAKTIVLDA